jgi:hypothetical protein
VLLQAKVRQGGAGRPATWPKIFEIFCGVLLDADFQKNKRVLFPNQICCASGETKIMQGK